MSDFLKIGKDTKYCKIKQGSLTVIFPYVTEKLDAQPILAQNTRPGFNPNKSNTTSSKTNKFINALTSVSKFTSKINEQSQDKGTPRETTISKIGNAGYKIEIDGFLTGDYYVQRNNTKFHL